MSTASSTTNFVQPAQHKHLRACMVCSVVQLQQVRPPSPFIPDRPTPTSTFYRLTVALSQRFLMQGCPNCEAHLLLSGNREAVDECTSQVYEGLITLLDPSASWVAKWQRLDGYVPGIYAVKVQGTLPEERILDLEGGGVLYIPRDGSGLDKD